ncbi:MAG: 16S rRNA (cytosine(967)-C(5))-methyltransferase RsmB [Candidatus Sumerlaeaceae bacterium]|nr:16S rRNA (cytosine(967)-C(5))-methyltransferase RsmB [Candidatus Sumerlaeaceae bacterium]
MSRPNRLKKKVIERPDGARSTALRTLNRLDEQREQGATEALDEAIREAALDPRDARLAAALVYVTLRNRLYLDWQLESLLRRPVSGLKPAVNNLLRLSAAQLLFFQRLPGHAMANEAVNLARHELRLPGHEAGFINAVARLLAAPDLPLRPMPVGDEVRRLSIQYSQPQWLVRMLRKKYGVGAVEPLLASLNEEPEIALRANTLRTSPEALATELASMGIETRPGQFVPEALTLTNQGQLSSLLSSPLFADGKFYIQDEASQVVALLVNPKPGERILDLCAAPGGKTTHLAELCGGKAEITATDLSTARLKLIDENLQRLGTPAVKISPYEEVARIADSDIASFDAILVDVPCSGLGTIRRNPEIRFRSSLESVRACAARQCEILSLAARLVRPGGRMVYSTCSVAPEENRAVVEDFLAVHSEFSIDVTPPDPTALKPLMTPDGYLETWPAQPHLDGFEAVRLRRAAVPSI